MDLEISSLEPVLFYAPTKDKPIHAKLGFITELFFFPFVFLLRFTKRLLSVFLRPGYLKKHYKWQDVLDLLLPVWIWIASSAPWWQVVNTWLWINCAGSFIFFSIAVNAAHHHPDAIKDGDEPVSQTPD